MNYGGWQIHVVPHNDEELHEATEHCMCNPEVDEDGMIIHKAFDNREAYERGERKTQ